MSLSSAKKLQQAVSRFKSVNILVIGDIIIDHFIWGTVSRISPEAPVPVVNVTRENLLLGGAANVLHNLYALGAKATICGIIGADVMGNHLLDLLKQLPSPTNGVIKTKDRPTTKKTRIIAQNQQVVRFDRERTGEPSRASAKRIRAFLDENLHRFDAVIVSDYSKGMINTALMEHLRGLLGTGTKIPIIVDPKPANAARFKGVTILTPNHHEAELMAGFTIDSEESLDRAAEKIRRDLQTEALLITRGEAGMALYEQGNAKVTIPTVAKEVYDVTGAGDTVIATLAVGMASGLPIADAAVLANFAAGIVVGKLGTATASTEELLQALS